MERSEIMKILPHRYPMLMVDDITEIEFGQRVCGYKDVKEDEIWFQGHYPGEPIFPGVLIAETMAQVSAFIFYNCNDCERVNVKPYLAKIEQMKFLSKVKPPCRLTVECTLDVKAAEFMRVKCTASSSGIVTAKGMLTCFMSVE